MRVDAELVPPPARSDAVAEVADPLAWLRPAERYAYDYFVQRLRRGGSETYPLAPDVQADLFELYLRGRPLREIFDVNKGRYSLGQVVHAAVDGDWPRRRLAVQDDMLSAAGETAARAGAEAANYIADGIAAAAKMQRDRVSRYLQTDDATGLGDLASPATFLKLVEALTKLTGSDKVERKIISGSVEHRIAPQPVTPTGDRAKMLKEWGDAEAAKKRR